MAELVLHHFDWSPYAEKVRVLLGIKGSGLAQRPDSDGDAQARPDRADRRLSQDTRPAGRGRHLLRQQPDCAGTRATTARTDAVSRRRSGTGAGPVRLGGAVLRRGCRARHGSQRRTARRPDAGSARILFTPGLRGLSCPRAAPVRPGHARTRTSSSASWPTGAISCSDRGPGSPMPLRITCCGWRAASSAAMGEVLSRLSGARTLGATDACDRPRRAHRTRRC